MGKQWLGKPVLLLVILIPHLVSHAHVVIDLARHHFALAEYALHYLLLVAIRNACILDSGCHGLLVGARSLHVGWQVLVLTRTHALLLLAPLHITCNRVLRMRIIKSHWLGVMTEFLSDRLTGAWMRSKVRTPSILESSRLSQVLVISRRW